MENSLAADLPEGQQAQLHLKVQLAEFGDEPKEEVQEAQEKEKKYKVIDEVIFVQGKQFVIKAEVSIDSDDAESVQTSMDDFEVDDEGVKDQYATKVKEMDKNRDEKEQQQIQKLEALLAKNDNS